MQNIDDAGAADAGRVIDAGVRKVVVIVELLRALIGKRLHVVLGAEVQTAGRAGLDARGLEALAHAIRAERALVDALGMRIEFRNVEGATRDAVATADTFVLLKIHDAVRVLDNRAVRGAGGQAARLGAVHALVLAHEPLESAVIAFVLVELDEVPVVPARFRHGLVSIVEDGFGEGQLIPLDASDLAGLAADAGGRVHELAYDFFALRARAGHRAGVTRDFLDAKAGLAHGVSLRPFPL